MQLFNDVLCVIFPDYCPGCGRTLNLKEQAICLHCMHALPCTHYAGVEENPVEKLLWGRVNFHAATAFLQFKSGGLTQRILHEIKYRGNQELAIEMGRLLGRDLVSCGRFKTVDCIVPVPLHPRKLKQRGFNQSALIAKGVSEMMPAMKETQFLQRVVHSKSQTKKSRWERWKNTHEVFSFEPPKDVDFAHVLLLDDVITTGATIESCLNAIQKNYSGVVSIATLACPMN